MCVCVGGCGLCGWVCGCGCGCACLPINAEGDCGLSITDLKINRQVCIASVNAVHTPDPVGYDSISKILKKPMRTNNVNRGAHSKKPHTHRCRKYE